MKVAIITGSSGLIGSQCVRFFTHKGFQCVGIDNNLREIFFGKRASTHWNLKHMQVEHPHFIHHAMDIRQLNLIDSVFSEYSRDIQLIVHAAAQPSHDFAAKDPVMDFTVNANGTLNVLESFRKHCPEAVFIFTSTNKVYGDLPNHLPLVEEEYRYEVSSDHPFFEQGIDETLSIDQSLHSLFGVSKASADLLVQEYGKYFNLKTGIFRGGCLTGPAHSGAELHGFLSYLMECLITDREYTVFGFKGKQVRDNMHSYDLVSMFWEFYQNPRAGEVYNAGGGRHSHCSLLEAVTLGERKISKKMKLKFVDTPRTGDHQWYISDVSKFKSHFPDWNYHYNFNQLLEELIEGTLVRLKAR